MRVPWTDVGYGRSAPLLPAGFRRNGKVIPIIPLLLIDTGADGTVVPRFNAGLLGFAEADLELAECGVAGTTVQMRRPRDIRGTEIEIDGRWLRLPSLMFADQIRHPVLGRDVIFANFELRMSATDFELIPLSDNP